MIMQATVLQHQGSRGKLHARYIYPNNSDWQAQQKQKH